MLKDLDKISETEIAIFNAINQYVESSTFNLPPAPLEMVLPSGTKLFTDYSKHLEYNKAATLEDLQYMLECSLKNSINAVRLFYQDVAITWLQFPRIVLKRSWLGFKHYEGGYVVRFKKVRKILPPITATIAGVGFAPSVNTNAIGTGGDNIGPIRTCERVAQLQEIDKNTLEASYPQAADVINKPRNNRLTKMIYAHLGLHDRR